MQNRILFILLILGTFLFDFLFWDESLGINLIIFDAFIFACTIFMGFRPSKSMLNAIVSVGLIATALAISIHSSVFSVFLHHLTFLLFIGLLHQDRLNSILFNIYAVFASFIRFPLILMEKFPKKPTQKFKTVFKFLKLSIIPILILGVFYVIYKNANPVFESLAIKFFKNLGDFIAPIFKNISMLHLFFIFSGFGLIAWILFKTKIAFVLERQSAMILKLIRTNVRNKPNNQQYNQTLKNNAPVYYRKKFALSMKIKYELISVFILLVLVNSLLLVVNLIDINWVWFGFEFSENFDMKQFVHEGTYLLIISILLSMGIMLYFFRKNLNFYNKAKWAKILTYCWIGQNLMLAISVGIRNFLYIEYWGLAYKRIGVILFLLAVIYGLIELFIKIRYKKTAYYLLKNNAMAAYIILLIASLFDWDSIIASHNLNHPYKNHIETSYLLCLSDKVLPQIDKQTYILDQDLKYNSYEDFSPHSYQQYYHKRVKKFMMTHQKKSWQSWNYAEWKAYKYFRDKYKDVNEF
jgi:hypothetical protein